MKVVYVKGFDIITKENGKDEQLTIEQWLLSSNHGNKNITKKVYQEVDGFISQSLTSAISFPLRTLNTKCIIYKEVNFMKKFQHSISFMGCKRFLNSLRRKQSKIVLQMG